MPYFKQLESCQKSENPKHQISRPIEWFLRSKVFSTLKLFHGKILITFSASLLIFGRGLAANEQIHVDLRNPRYQNGEAYTDEGGVITAKNLRIQARSIHYIHQNTRLNQKHIVEASGDLLVLYKNQVFIGSKLEYDFATKTGIVYEGKTFSGLWYISGEKITFDSDANFSLDGASITLSENKESDWDLYASNVQGLKSHLFTAQNITFRLFNFPTFWLPSAKWNLDKTAHDPLYRYYFNWDKSQNIRLGMRYQLYSWKDFSLFTRLEYRWKTGWGGALETEYFPPDGQTRFATRSYIGTDRLETAPNKQFRYRFEGAHNWQSKDGNTFTVLNWDKYSDVRMPSDFKSEDFEVGTTRQTLFWLRHQFPNSIFSFKARPRANPFESIKQDLPTVYYNILPRNILNTKILSSLLLKASYLDFAYSNQLSSNSGLPLPTDYRSGRIEVRERLHRPFSIHSLVCTPNLEAIGIFYSNSPIHKPKFSGLLSYGIDLRALGKKDFTAIRHLIEPYAAYQALSQPTTLPDDHYIFSITDGFNKIHQFRAGLRNSLFDKAAPEKQPWFSTDIYANAFFSNETIPQLIPKLYLWMEWQLPSVHLSFHNAWNFRNQLLDFSNTRCRWTINEDIALSLEARYRSQYDWRKADHENFILDVTRPQSQLLSSPLSDQRMTLLADLFIRLSALWECHFQSHHGFLRSNETPYNEFQIDLYTWVASSLKLKLSYSHTDKDDRFSWQMSLLKK